MEGGSDAFYNLARGRDIMYKAALVVAAHRMKTAPSFCGSKVALLPSQDHRETSVALSNQHNLNHNQLSSSLHM